MHRVQDDAPPVEVTPAGHTLHPEAPGSEYNPTGQGRQAKPTEKVPAGHTSQADDEERDHEPSGQAVHEPPAPCVENEPAWHG